MGVLGIAMRTRPHLDFSCVACSAYVPGACSCFRTFDGGVAVLLLVVRTCTFCRRNNDNHP